MITAAPSGPVRWTCPSLKWRPGRGFERNGEVPHKAACVVPPRAWGGRSTRAAHLPGELTLVVMCAAGQLTPLSLRDVRAPGTSGVAARGWLRSYGSGAARYGVDWQRLASPPTKLARMAAHEAWCGGPGGLWRRSVSSGGSRFRLSGRTVSRPYEWVFVRTGSWRSGRRFAFSLRHIVLLVGFATARAPELSAG